MAAAITRPARWSRLTVALNIVGQLGLLVVTGKWPLQPPTRNTMRGIDFYPWRDLLRALTNGALIFKAENGYLPWLASPTSFNEHIFARKFFALLPMPSLADKLAAKDFVKARLGDECLPAVAWVGDDIGELFAAKPPTGRYVLKANHGCESNLFLNLPDDLTAKRDEIEQWATSWLARRFGYDWGEWQYCTFKPKLFLEKFIDFNGDQVPLTTSSTVFTARFVLLPSRSTVSRSSSDQLSIPRTGSTFLSPTASRRSSAHGRAISRT